MGQKKLAGYSNIKHWLLEQLALISQKDMSIKRKNTAAKKSGYKGKRGSLDKDSETVIK
ncbi:hypothetical protein PXH59_00065 (plasmid) [Xenorhabdus sp. SF857]|uniref:hypothetical protein n=1 Tax=Xenorhabdus bakwenae TaxID=3026967 RepID=UPI002557CBBA|nr:hypothetical protein [Xenorhabdus sp. SF857]WFQ78078.1 hypothetical protein PXH59_00065 [Xenorhabdus sp. SF857]